MVVNVILGLVVFVCSAAAVFILYALIVSAFSCDHETVTIQNFGSLARRIGCRKCGKSWYVHDGMHINQPWGEYHINLYRNTFGFTLTPWEGDDDE